MLTKALKAFCQFSWPFYLKTSEVEPLDQRTAKQQSAPIHPWINQVQRSHLTDGEYFSDLKCWVQPARLEKEEKKDFSKSGGFLDLLQDLEDCP